jgi:hypothetical protein
VSSRFGPQQTGGTIIQHVRPVDLQASMAQAAAILARWATLLMLEEGGSSTTPDLTSDIAGWHTLAAEFSARTRQMWWQGWFHDFDAVSGEWSEQRDAMHLAPVFALWPSENRWSNCVLHWRSPRCIAQAGPRSHGLRWS